MPIDNMSMINSFVNLASLPLQLKMDIVDGIALPDSCDLPNLSELTNEECFKLPANNVHTLALDINSEGNVSVSMIIQASGLNNNEEEQDLTIHFRCQNGQKFVICERSGFDDELVWSGNLDGMEYFRNVLELNQSSIKSLAINNFASESFDFKVENLRNLEQLSMINVSETTILHIFSKLQKPLRSLDVSGKFSTLQNCYQVYQVEDVLRIPGLQLSYEQCQQLSASKILINIGNLCEQDIANLIQSCITGNNEKIVKRYAWNCAGSSFNARKIFKLFGSDFVELLTSYNIEQYIYFEHPDKYMIAKLTYNESTETLKFIMLV